MNRSRRRALVKIKTALDRLREAVEEIQIEEQSYFDVMPEPFQQGEKGEEAEQNVEQMFAIIDALETASTEFDVLLCA